GMGRPSRFASSAIVNLGSLPAMLAEKGEPVFRIEPEGRVAHEARAHFLAIANGVEVVHPAGVNHRPIKMILHHLLEGPGNGALLGQKSNRNRCCISSSGAIG